MKMLRVSASWIDRAASSPDEGPIFAGPATAELPNDSRVNDLLGRVSRTNVAREMARRGWLGEKAVRPSDRQGSLEEFFFSHRPFRPQVAAAASFRRQPRDRDFVDELATTAWIYRVAEVAQSQAGGAFSKSAFDQAFLKSIAQLTAKDKGPVQAIRELADRGIRVIVESGLPGMRVDGASFLLPGVRPVIGLTLRFDRIDSFWFTLMHEVAHVLLHLISNRERTFVDTTTDDLSIDIVDEEEAEADAFAKDALIPRDMWARSDAFRLGTEPAIRKLASQCAVHPAIVAGRLRYERRNYAMHSQLLGEGTVRQQLASMQ